MNNMDKVEEIQPTALMQLEKASIDMQVATAHQFPRSVAQFQRRAIDMATLDDETAESCLYKRPVGGGKMAEGKSVRMAEIVGASYGNLRVAARIIEQSERQVIVQGVAHDLESNFLASTEVVESTVKRDGTPYDERMRIVVAKAAMAKARRDATFQVVPAAMCKSVENACRQLLFGNEKSIGERRDLAKAYISKLPIKKERVFDALKIKGYEDIGAEQLEVLTGLRNAMKSNDITLDEAFPVDKIEEAINTELSELKEKSRADLKSAKADSITDSFMVHGYSSEKKDKEEMIEELLSKVLSIAKLENVMKNVAKLEAK